MDPNTGFTSPSLGPSKPGAGLSRPPRLAKLKKPLAGHRPHLYRPVSQLGVGHGLEESGLESTRIDPGIGTAKPAFESSPLSVGGGFVFGSKDSGHTISHTSESNLFSENIVKNSVDTSKVVDDMTRLKIEGEKRHPSSMNVKISSGSHTSGSRGNVHLSGNNESLRGVDERGVSELLDEMRRSYIESGQFNKFYGGNLEELPNKMKKLNMKDCENDVTNNFGFGRSDGNFSGRTLDTVLQDKMKNLNMEDSLYASMNEKVADVSGNTNQPVDLNMTSAPGNSSNHNKSNTSLHSGAETMHGMLAKNLDDGNLHNFHGSSNSSFTFQTGLESKNSGTHLSSENGSTAASFPGFASSDIHCQPFGSVPEMPSLDRVGKKAEFRFTSRLDSVAAKHVEFKTPDSKAHSLFGLNRKVETKRESAKDSGLKKKKGKFKKPAQVPVMFQQDFVFQENLQENAEFSEQYSPMDLSPYEETLVHNSFSRETSVASEESFNLDQNNSSTEAYPNVSNDIVDEVLVSSTEGLCINECDVKSNEGQDEESAYFVSEGIKVDNPEEDAISGVETESFKSATDELDYSTDSFVTAQDTEGCSSFKIERQDSDGVTQFKYDTFSADMSQSSFTFAASPSSLEESSASIGIQKKKNRSKICHDSYSSTPIVKVSQAASHLPSFQFTGSSFPSPEKGNISTVLSQKRDKSDHVRELVRKQDSATSATIAAQESCEKWRLRCDYSFTFA